MVMSEEAKALAYATLLPGACGIISSAVVASDPDSWQWYKNLKRPAWAVPAKHALAVHTVIDVATLAPLAYATTKVWDYGGGPRYSDTRLALAVYGANFGLMSLFAPIMKKRSLSASTVTMGLLFCNSALMHHLYRNIHKESGYLTIPYCLAAAYYTCMFYRIWEMNEQH